MSERFERLYQLPANLYSESSPVIVVAGALLKDSVSGSVIAQIKYKSVSSLPIKALKLDIEAFDVSGKKLQGVDDYQYLDLVVHYGMEFGSNKAIVMPVAVTRTFAISKITVVFSDGSSWVSTSEMVALPESNSLQAIMCNPELQKQYRLATTSEAKYIPSKYFNLWKCTCGAWNGNSKCHNCRCEKESVFTALDLDMLSEKMETRLATEREQREEQARLLELARQEKIEQDRLAADKEAERKLLQKKKLTRIAVIVAPILAIISVFALWIYPSFIKPVVIEQRLDKAVAILKESGSYSEEDVLDALSLAMTAGLDKRLTYADGSSETTTKEYWQYITSAEEYLLSIGELHIDNKTISNALSDYIEGWKLQKKVFDNYASSPSSNYDNLSSEYDWIVGYRTRAAAIIQLYEEGIVEMTDDDYGEYCIGYIEKQLEKELVGTVTLSWYDDDHYSITATLKNDTLADFEGFEVWSLWNDEEVYATIDTWKSGKTWQAEFVVSADSLESDDISLEFGAYFDSITVQKPNN